MLLWVSAIKGMMLSVSNMNRDWSEDRMTRWRSHVGIRNRCTGWANCVSRIVTSGSKVLKQEHNFSATWLKPKQWGSMRDYSGRVIFIKDISCTEMSTPNIKSVKFLEPATPDELVKVWLAGTAMKIWDILSSILSHASCCWVARNLRVHILRGESYVSMLPSRRQQR